MLLVMTMSDLMMLYSVVCVEDDDRVVIMIWVIVLNYVVVDRVIVTMCW